MKLGSETGSLMNHLHSRSVIGEPTPVIGMGATLLDWSDRSPATVVAFDGKILEVQSDNYSRVDSNGMSEEQEYKYEQNPKGMLHYFRKDKNGLWTKVAKNEETGRWNKLSGCGLRLGSRERYYDFSF